MEQPQQQEGSFSSNDRLFFSSRRCAYFSVKFVEIQTNRFSGFRKRFRGKESVLLCSCCIEDMPALIFSVYLRLHNQEWMNPSQAVHYNACVMGHFTHNQNNIPKHSVIGFYDADWDKVRLLWKAVELVRCGNNIISF